MLKLVSARFWLIRPVPCRQHPTQRSQELPNRVFTVKPIKSSAVLVEHLLLRRTTFSSSASRYFSSTPSGSLHRIVHRHAVVARPLHLADVDQGSDVASFSFALSSRPARSNVLHLRVVRGAP
eukprot:13204454-Heterocapsa_arctica.AAC.1